jgi:hypothetical protein
VQLFVPLVPAERRDSGFPEILTELDALLRAKGHGFNRPTNANSHSRGHRQFKLVVV